MFTEQKITSLISYLLYALVAAVPLVYFQHVLFPYQIPKTVVFQGLAELIIVFWALLALFNKYYRPKWTPLTVAFTLFIVIYTLAAWFGVDLWVSLWSDEQRSIGLIFVWHVYFLYLALTALREKINWDVVWRVAIYTAGVVALFAIVGVWNQNFFGLRQNPARPGSTFGNPAFLAGYLLFFFFASFRILGDEIFNNRLHTKGIMFWSIALSLVFIIVALFLAKTLGALLGLVTGLFFFSLFLAFQRDNLVLKKVAALAILTLALFGGLFWYTHTASIWSYVPGLNKAAEFSFANEAIHDRLLVWQIGVNAFKKKSLLGWGPENFRLAYNDYYDPRLLTNTLDGTYWDKPHNVLVERAVDSGALGLIAYLFIFIAALYELSKIRSVQGEGRVDFLKFSFAGLLIAYLIQNLFIFDTVSTYLFFAVSLAFIDSYYAKQHYIGRDTAVAQESGNVSRDLFSVGVLFAFAIALVPLYFNYQIFLGAQYEYWGVNYFLNRLLPESLASFRLSLTTQTPYLDDAKKNFAGTIKQAYQQNVIYPNLGYLQAELVAYEREVIANHPKDFFNYIALAEFEEVFYQFDDTYLTESEKLATDALALSPRRQQTYYALAKVKLRKGDIQGAYDIFDTVVNLNPDAGDPHFFFGIMAYGIASAELDRATKDLYTVRGDVEIQKAKELGRVPRNPNEAITLGNFMGDLKNDYPAAAKFYLAALQMDKFEGPQRLDVLLKLALAYYYGGDYEDSRTYFLELQKVADIKKMTLYPQLQPILKQVKVE